MYYFLFKLFTFLLFDLFFRRIKPLSNVIANIRFRSLEKLSEGKVIAVGPGGLDKDGKMVKTNVKVGDKVIIPAYGGSNIKVGDQEYQFYHDYELLATISS
ncbi:hypothetical protein PNEG_01852 [Pneumocystis murina B123]|uniref:10 kDa heat shock protein, mitochondrial n=1 Tax=Pneumocystis murina (strain B123) TaxID=1069680 RepID=M7NQX9_PNEMU|nr:hypothetical protein PNEG_01852 [Pneumocystis murina B123]EMR09662.1 hypothetical protein PNEG_01852 [Pneumocystis murina B123]